MGTSRARTTAKRSRGKLIVTGVVVVAAAAGIVAIVRTTGPNASAAPPTTEPRNTASVTRRDLVETKEYDSTVDYGDAVDLPLGAEGTLTWLPAVGDTLDNGSKVAEVDGQPVIAVRAAFPFWRTLSAGVDDGKDVLQLEYLLASLGYRPSGMEVDDHFNATTAKALKAFEKDHGLEADGVLSVGELEVIDGPKRVAEVGGLLGQPASEAGITVTGGARLVRADVPADEAALVPVGGHVDVELADGSTVDGTVAEVGAAKRDNDGNSVVPIGVSSEGAAQLPDDTAVTVDVDDVKASGVLAVPVEAVLALAEGGYGLEIADADGASHLVRVDLGSFADGWVAVSGSVDEGIQVVIP